MNIYEKLMNIQSELKAPKSQFNGFGKYAYRNCEDILEALKPLLDKYKATLILTDEIVVLGEHSPFLYKEEIFDVKSKTTKEETKSTGSQRYYIKSTARLIDIENGEEVNSTAYAREEENKKEMDSSQLTGSTSSYARKYALNGLFAIDDTKDSDTTNNHDKEPVELTKDAPTLSDAQIKRLYAIGKSKDVGAKMIDKSILTDYKKDSPDQLTKKEYDALCKRLEAIQK